MAEGPRAVRPEEFESLMTMIDAVFRPGQDPAMGEEYPHLFTPDNFSNLRVIREDEKIVSHVGTTIRDATLLGCHVRVGNIGAVGTYKEYRGRGFAGACFDDACANARAQGVDFMHISGDRSLYRRAGCRRVGLDEEFTVSREVVATWRSEQIVERYTDRRLLAVQRLYMNEPVRYLRPLEEWQRVVRDGRSTHAGAELWVARRGETVVAYAALTPPRSDGTATLQEFAGDRVALLGALHDLMERNHTPDQELKAIRVHVPSYDQALSAVLLSSGLAPKLAHAGGTQLILNFPQFMARLRPLIEERAGSAEAARLSCRDYGGVFVFVYDGETIVSTDRGGAAQLIWGTREPQEWQWASEGQGKEVLQAVFPVPALNYGFSYV